MTDIYESQQMGWRIVRDHLSRKIARATRLRAECIKDCTMQDCDCYRAAQEAYAEINAAALGEQAKG